MDLGRIKFIPLIKETAREIHDDDVMGLAAEVAYRLIFALPPLIIFFTALSTVADQYTGVDVFAYLQNQVMASAIPPAVQETFMLVLNTVKNQNSTGFLSLGIVIALWSASGALNAMIKALNRAYDVKDGRNFITQRFLSLLLTIGMSLLIVASFVLFVFGSRLGRWLAVEVGFGAAYAVTWRLVRWPLIVILFMFALAILYWVGPAIKHRFRLISPGAVMATVLWLGATWGFSLYLRLADPGSAYGTVGTVVVLLFFLYISTIMLLIGAELNAVLDKRFDPEVVMEKAAHPELQTEDPSVLAERVRRLAQSPANPAFSHSVSWRRHPSPGANAVSHRSKSPTEPESSRGAAMTLMLWLGSLLVARIGRALHRGRTERV